MKLLDRTLSGEYRNDRVTGVGTRAFTNCTALTKVVLPAVQTVGTYGDYNQNHSFAGSALEIIDLASCTKIAMRGVSEVTKLKALVLRNTEQVCKLTHTQGFYSTGSAYIYVPSALVDSYKAATNWSTYAARFRALEDYTVDGTTTGELDESKITA